MGKQNNSVTYVSQAKFDKDLNSSVDILIADGADDNTIKEYIQDYKSRFAVAEKKNSVSNGTSEVPQSESPAQQTQKKSLSVGGKPIQTGGSASSVGVSKEDLISKFGFKNKEEQKKAGVEASKVKIDAKAPSAVKPVSVKENEFIKPEINKAQKETSLFQQKIKREEENAFINDFRNAISVTDNYEQEVRSEIENEISGNGVWNTITQGAKNIWNKVVPYIHGAPSSQSELDQLKTDINFLPEAKKEYKESLIQSGVKLSDINDDMLTKGAIELEVKKRLEDKKLSLANDYLDSLPIDIKDRIKINTLNKLGINDVELNKKRNYLLATDKEIDGIKNEISALEEEFENNSFFSPESQQKYKELILNINNKVDERNAIYKKYEKELSEKTTLEEEFDLFKRSYGFEDKTGRLLNSLADFGIGVLQAVNIAKGGPTQDLTATQILGLKLEKDKLANDYLQKQVKETKNINDFIDYSMDVIISQTPNIALGYMTGGTSMMAGIGVSSFGNTYSNLLQSNLEGKTDYSKSQLYFASGLYGASEALFEKNTLGMIGSGKNLIKKALKNETTKEVVKKSLFNKVVDPIVGLGKDYKGELTEELKTLLSQKITDVVVLDMDSKDVFKNAKEEVISLAKDTGVMTFGLKTFPATFAKILEPFATKEYKDTLKSNSEKIDGLSEILNNEFSSELAKSESKNKIDQLVAENDKATEKLIKDISSLDEELIKEVVDLQSKSEDLKERANNINSDNSLSIEQKKMLLDDLKSEFIRNQEAIYDIVSGQKTSFDILPEEEQVKFKNQASEAIIQEELDKGVEREKIKEPNPEVINKKAIEIYESSKQTTGQVSEQEKPATTTEAEAVSTTQASTETKPQEEVKTTSKTTELKSPIELNDGEELIDVKEDGKGNTYTYVSNVEVKDDVKTTTFSFNRSDKPSSQRNKTSIDSSKILDKYGYEINQDQIPEDSKLVSITEIREGKDSSDATVFFETDGQKYEGEVKLTPKTETDAIQEQSTSETPVQPETSIGEEVEKGESKAKPEEPTEQSEEKVGKVTPIKEVKDQLQDLFSAAKEAVRVTKDKAKEINKLKNDLNQFVAANLVGLDASDIGKAAIKSINSAIQKTNDVNFEEQAEKINGIIDDLYLRKELKDEKVLDKKIEEMSKDTFYKDKTSSKVTKTKVTDAFKKKIEEAKKNFAKINNPSIADKTAFVIEMNNLYKQGVAERKKIDESERSRSKENASKLSIFALKKDGRVDDKKRISLGSKNVEEAFKKGGVIYNGNIYLNTEKGRADFARDTEGFDSVIVNPISTPVTASGSEMVRNQNSGTLSGISKYMKDLKRRYATATFSAERFFAPFYTVKGAKEFIENNWNNKLKVYSERIGRQISEFKDVRDEFLSDVLGKELLSKRKWWAKSKTASRIAAELSILRAEKSGKDPLSAFVSKNNIRFEVDMLDDTNVLSFQEAVGVFDKKIKEEANPDNVAKLKQQKEEFVNKYIAFEGMTNEGVAALFNMLRQPEGFNKFLNSFSIKDALAIVNYVQDNPKIREIADKSSKMFESIRDYVNPTLDKLGYDTLGESDYISKENALSAIEVKDKKRTEGFYEMLDIIYPNGLPEKVPYFPLSAEGLSGTNESNVLEFFEDTENPNADYSLLFPSLFTRKSGGNLNLQNLSIESVFDKVSKEAVTMVNGVDIASDLRNLYANEGNNVAMLNAFGKGWNEQFKKKVLNIIKDDAYESALNQNDVVGKGLKVWITSRSLQRAAQLAFNVFSAFSQIFGTGVAYSKGDNLRYLKDTMKNLASTSKRKAEIERLSSAYNAIINSKNYKERVNKRRDNADVAAVKSVKEKTGFALAGDILSDMLFLTTIADQLSVMSLAPIYAGKYANIDGISEAEKIDEFFAEEVNKTLQSNAPYYTGTAFYNKWSLALGVGGYLQSPRQGMELILNETEAILRKEGDYKKRTARIISLMSFSAILPTIFKDVLRGSDDDEEDEKSKADKRTEALQVANKIGDAILESTGLGGSTISAIKNATLIKTSPEIMEMDLSPSDVKASDMIMQLIKGASPNLSITLRNIDNVIDNKGIYSTQDQLAYGIETGVGFPAAQFKKQMDYLSALGSEYYDFYDYFDLVSGKVSQAEFKKFEKEISNLTETLDKVIYPYETKEGALNTSFLNKKQINELSKMSFEQKANYVEEIRLMLINKAVVEQVEMYKKGSDGIDKSRGFYKVRESKFKNELSDMIYDLLKNKYYSEDNAINVEDLKTKLIEFRKDNNISAKSSVDIFKESYKKAEQKMIEEVTIPLIKKVKDYNKGRDRAKFLYDAIGDMQYEDRFRYIKMIGEEFDEETQIEYVNILNNKQERGE